MEKLLARLARQLDTIDEASLMSLWSKYATAASRFEPTKRWEEAALIFSLIQAKRWKNQLFNYYWSHQTQAEANRPASAPQSLAPDFELEAAPARAADEPPAPQRCRVLAFRPGSGEASGAAPAQDKKTLKDAHTAADSPPCPEPSGSATSDPVAPDSDAPQPESPKD